MSRVYHVEFYRMSPLLSEGTILGSSDGIMLRTSDRTLLGIAEGTSEGTILGSSDGIMLGTSDRTGAF